MTGYGDYPNGQIPYDVLVLCRGAWLQPRAAYYAEAMSLAFNKRFGKHLVYSEGYRDLERQVYLYNGWKNGEPGFFVASYPGGSNHGRALSVDVDLTGMTREQIEWLHTEGRKFGWNWDTIGRPNGEDWHLDFNLEPEPFDPNDYNTNTNKEDDSMSAADVAELKQYIDNKGHGLRLIQCNQRGIGVVGAGYYKTLTEEELPFAVGLWGWPENYGDNPRAYDLAVSISINGKTANDDEVERDKEAMEKFVVAQGKSADEIKALIRLSANLQAEASKK